MNEEERVALYVFGFLGTIAFGARFLVQWLYSEVQGRSVVPRAFWIISLLGNGLMVAHSLVQMQFHVAVIQACNGVIACRNLNFMSPPPQHWRLSSVVWCHIVAVGVITALFALQSPISISTWMRTPVTPWQDAGSTAVAPLWHIIGTFGIILFSLRFWIQWWQAEQHRSGDLGTAFWLLSIGGGFLTLLYFARIHDPVNLIGPTLGMIPYVRNLILRARHLHEAH